MDIYDVETDTVGDSLDTFPVGSTDCVDVIGDNGDSVDMQFGDGSMAYNVLKDAFEDLGEA